MGGAHYYSEHSFPKFIASRLTTNMLLIDMHYTPRWYVAIQILPDHTTDSLTGKHPWVLKHA